MSVLIGTLYPLALDVLAGQKISVGPPYFEAVFVPIMVPAIFLMGVGPMARWKHAPLPELARRLRWALAASGAAALLLPLTLPAGAARLVAAVDLRAAAGGVGRGERGGACLAAASRRTRRLARRARGASRAAGGACWPPMPASACSSSARRWPTVSRAGGSSSCTRASSVTLAGYEFRFEGIAPASGPNYDAQRATVQVTRDGAVGGDAASGEAHLPRAADAAEPGGHRRRPDARSLRRAGRAGRRRGLDHAPARQALHGLDLGRLPADGLRWPARGHRSPLPARRWRRRGRPPARAAVALRPQEGA